MEREKIFINNISDKESISKIYTTPAIQQPKQKQKQKQKTTQT